MKTVYVDTQNLLDVYNKIIPKSISELNSALIKAKSLTHDRYNLVESIKSFIKSEENICDWAIKVNNLYFNCNATLLNGANKLPVVNIKEK